MADKIEKIQKLQTRVEKAKSQIEQSRQLSNVEKMKKAKELEEAISKIKVDLDLLRVSATPEELAEIDTLESSYEEMNNQFQLEFKTQLDSLKTEVQENISEQTIESKKNPEEEKSWLGKKWDNTSEGVKTGIKVVGFAVGGYLVLKGIKNLFGRGKDKKEGSEKEGFWNHGIGEGIKYIGMSIAGAFGGRWLFNNRDKVKSWFDFESPEKKLEKHEKFSLYRDKHQSEFDQGIEYNKNGKYKFEYRKEFKDFNSLVVFDKEGILDEAKTAENIKKWKLSIDEKLMNHTSLKEADEILKKNPKLNNLGNNINNFHQFVGISNLALGEADYDNEKPGLILAQLSNMKTNIGELLNKGSYEQLLEQVDKGYIERIMNWALSISKEAGASTLIWITQLIPDVEVPFGGNITKATKEELLARAKELTEDQQAQFEQHARTIFLKRMNSITYLQAVRNQYIYNLVKAKLSNTSFDKLSNEDQDELIQDKLEDEAFIKANISSTLDKFDNLSLIDLADTQDQNLIQAMENPSINSELSDTLLDIDNQQNNRIEGINNAETDEEVKEIADELIDDINVVGYNTRYAGMQTRWNSAFETDADKMHQMAEGQYSELMKGTLDKINNIKNKTTLTESDKQELRELIEGYTKTKKSMLLAGQYKTDTTDEGMFTRYILPIREGTQKKYRYLSTNETASGLEWVGFRAEAGLGAITIGGSAYLVGDVITWLPRKIKQVFKSGGFKVNGPTDRVIRKTMGKSGTLLWRGTVRPFGKGLRYYNTFGDRFLGILKHDFINGRLSINEIEKILKSKKMIVGVSEDSVEIFSKLFGINEGRAKRLLEIYNKDKNLFSKLIDKSTKLKYVRRFKYDLNMKRLEFLETMIKNEKELGIKIFSGLKKVKDFDKFQKLFTTKPSLFLLEDYLKYSDDIAAAIAKNMNKINSVEDINKIMKHISANGSKIPDKGAFFSNAMRNLKALRKSNFDFGTKSINKLKLNVVTKKLKIKRLQSSLKGAEDAVKRVMRTAPQSKLAGLKTQLRQLSVLRNARFESLSALEFGFGNSNILASLYSNPSILSKLSKLSPSVLTEIAKLNKFTDVKRLLKAHNIEGLSDDVIRGLVDMKKAKNIQNLFINAKNYPKYQTGFGRVLGVLKSPGMRYISKMFGRAIGGLAIGLSVYHGVDIYGEGSDLVLSGQNIQRGKMKKEAGVVTGAVGALAGALMFVPGVGWVLGAVVGTSEILVGAYYETVDKYLQNFNDLISKTDLYVKETIISIVSGIRNNDRSWEGDRSRLVQYVKANTSPIPMSSDPLSSLMLLIQRVDFDAEGSKVLEASMKALIHLDELKKHPYASINYKDKELPTELKDSGITESVIATELETVRQNRDDRFDYFKGNYGSINNIISDNDLESGKSLSKITQIVNHTDLFIQLDNVSTKGDLDKYMKTIEKKLDKIPYKTFETLSDKQLLYYYHHRESLIDNTDTIEQNKKIFEGYMQYKSFKGNLDLFDTANTGLYEIDRTELINFFTDIKILPKNFSNQEVQSEYLDMTSTSYSETEKMFNISSNPIQNSLYTIIKDVIGIPSIQNNQESIQNYLSGSTNDLAESHYGLYFDSDGELNINGSSWLGRDDEFNWDSDIGDVIKEIERQFNAGDAVTQGSGDEHINKELGAQYLNIFKQEQEIIDHKKKYEKQILSNIKKYTIDGGYIRLPLNDIELGLKLGITDIAKCLYKVENNKVKTYKPGGYFDGRSV